MRWLVSMTQWTWIQQTLGESGGQRSLAGCIPWGCKELDMTVVTQQQQILKYYFHILGWHILVSCVCVLSQTCPTLCDPMDCSLPGSSVHKILQARMLEWVAISFSTGSSRPKGWTHVFLCLLHWQVGSLPLAPPGKPILVSYNINIHNHP